ncbi:MAG: anti-sigma factor domain-containing protein [Peptococcaceae bacterium]|nr:anti-sigma factor domain-containing protein [Peptococcaceae bacterium]
MTRKGIVFKVKPRSVIVMTGDFEFEEVRKREPVEVGHEITFSDENVVRYRRTGRFIALAASLLIVLIVSASMMRYLFWVPEVYAYVGMDINPSLELALDKNFEVIKAQAYNRDAEAVLEGLTLKGVAVNSAVRTILKACSDRGYLKDGPNVVITTTLVKEGQSDIDLDRRIISAVRTELEKTGQNSRAYLLHAELQDREQALKQHLSTGRYVIWQKVQEQGGTITLDELRAQGVGRLLARHEAVQQVMAKHSAIKWEKADRKAATTHKPPAKRDIDIQDRKVKPDEQQAKPGKDRKGSQELQSANGLGKNVEKKQPGETRGNSLMPETDRVPSNDRDREPVRQGGPGTPRDGDAKPARPVPSQNREIQGQPDSVESRNDQGEHVGDNVFRTPAYDRSIPNGPGGGAGKGK